MKKYLDPDFIMSFLIFCVIQPGIIIVAVTTFVWSIITHLL